MGFGSYVAACAEVSVDGNKVKVHRIVGATDPGYAVNPAQIDRQIAGSFIYGLTALFLGECTVKDGAIEQTNLDTYEMMHHRPDAEGRVDRDAVGRHGCGAASASRPSAWRRPRCSTPSRRRPASAIAPSRSRTTA